jgi:hypothetical protein
MDGWMDGCRDVVARFLQERGVTKEVQIRVGWFKER